MFCPEGYKTIHDVRSSVVGFEWSKGEHPNQTSSEAFENFVFETILEKDALRICSPDGVVLRVSDEILDKAEIDDWLKDEPFPIWNFNGVVANYEDFPEGAPSSELRWPSFPLFSNAITTRVR